MKIILEIPDWFSISTFHGCIVGQEKDDNPLLVRRLSFDLAGNELEDETTIKMESKRVTENE